MGTNYSRLKAMANAVRRRGGEGRALVEQEIGKEMLTVLQAKGDADRRLEELNELAEKVKTPPCTVKDGFTIPEATCKCGTKGVPTAYFDGESVHTSLFCENCSDDVALIDWPFNEERAYWDDFEKLGFNVET